MCLTWQLEAQDESQDLQPELNVNRRGRVHTLVLAVGKRLLKSIRGPRGSDSMYFLALSLAMKSSSAPTGVPVTWWHSTCSLAMSSFTLLSSATTLELRASFLKALAHCLLCFICNICKIDYNTAGTALLILPHTW